MRDSPNSPRVTCNFATSKPLVEVIDGKIIPSRGPHLIASLIESLFGLTGRGYTARCGSLKGKAQGYDALVRDRILGAAASLRGLPEIPNAFGQKRPSMWDRGTIF